MVAQIADVAKSSDCSGPEAYFCRLIAVDGFTPTRAYRIAWKSDAIRAKDIAPRILARPRVQAYLAELKAQALAADAMDLRERRGRLGRIARAGTDERRLAEAKPCDAIAAIREDAILAGERRSDGSQIALSIDVTANIVVAALRGLTEPRNVTEVVGAQVLADATTGNPPGHLRDSVRDVVVHETLVAPGHSAPAEAYGPLGVIEESAAPAPALPATSFVDSE